jgi:EAL domain-containing protein (putative c-di-GMP-specific phosphodiesterase class I)/DNA-binding NarL/FixJ family response regulator
MNIAQSCAEDLVYNVGASRRFMPKVLFVDDEPQVVEGIRRALRDHSYRINTATSPEVALHMCRREQFDVIVADELMPGMCGSELLTIVSREFPTTGRILLTGHATVEAAARAINEAGVIRLLLKPCPPSALRAAIELALRTTPFEHRTRAGRNPGADPRWRTHAAIRARLSGKAATSRLVSRNRMACADPAKLIRRGADWHLESSARGLRLWAQKIFTLNATQLAGFEISPRLQAQAHEPRTARDFMASADHHVVQDALRALGKHERQVDLSDLTVSLNIGCQSLAIPGFADFLEDELSAARLAARFMIEVRESTLTQRLRTDPGFLMRLASMKCLAHGTQLCIDGVTGEIEQLALLADLPIALAKINSRYIGDVLMNPQSESRVRAVVEWGRRAGVEIAAAGVDTFAISERLHALGVHYGQGSAFGTPQPLELIVDSLGCHGVSVEP